MVLYRGFSFQSFIHELVALIHFIHGTRFHSFMSCYCCMVAVILGYDWNVPYILLYCYPYVIPTFHVVIIHR